MLLAPCLFFNGNCREAMTFYQSCIGGELQFQTMTDIPSHYPWPQPMQDFILQACLEKDEFKLCASDLPMDDFCKQGNNISLWLVCGTYQELHDIYLSLSHGAELLQCLGKNVQEDWFVSLKDKYGHYWTITCHGNN